MRNKFALKLLVTLKEAEEDFFKKLKKKFKFLVNQTKFRLQVLQKLCELESVTSQDAVTRLKALKFVKLADLPVPDSLKS